MGYIYCITNTINGKQYVGQTRHSVRQRFLDHCKSAQREDREHRPLYRAMRKYGQDAFTITTLAEVPNEDLNVAEQQWIQKLQTYRNGYNATIGGDGKYKYSDNEYQQIIQHYKDGLNVLDISRLMHLDYGTVAKTLHAVGIDTKQNAQAERYHAVAQYTTSGILVATYPSIRSAAIALLPDGTSAQHSRLAINIGRVTRGMRKICAGYTWRLLEPNLE